MGNTEIIPDRSPLVRSFTRYVTINALVFSENVHKGAAEMKEVVDE